MCPSNAIHRTVAAVYLSPFNDAPTFYTPYVKALTLAFSVTRRGCASFGICIWIWTELALIKLLSWFIILPFEK